MEGLKFFCEKKEKRRLEGCWSLWWEGFLIVFIVAIETIKKAETMEIESAFLFLYVLYFMRNRKVKLWHVAKYQHCF